METNKHPIKNTHHGDAIRRIRRSLGIKQETLAKMMGITQAGVSNFEQKKKLEDDAIEKFANALKVSPELIKELSVDPVTYIIKNKRFEKVKDAASSNTVVTNKIDPLDRLIELSHEETDLHERMLELQKERNKLIKQFLLNRNKDPF